MSTKIYNGFKFKSKDISRIQSNLLKLTDPVVILEKEII